MTTEAERDEAARVLEGRLRTLDERDRQHQDELEEVEGRLQGLERPTPCRRCNKDHDELTHLVVDQLRVMGDRFPSNAIGDVDAILEGHFHLDKLFGQAETITIATDVMAQPRRKFVRIAAQSGTSDDLDGISVKNVKDGFAFLATPDAGDTITFTHQNSGGTSGERLSTGGSSLVLAVGEYALVVYDSTASTANPWFVSVIGTHTMASHSDDDTYNISTTGTAATGALTVTGGTFVGGSGASFNICLSLEDPTASEDFTLCFGFAAFTIQEMQAVLVGSSSQTVTWTVRHTLERDDTGIEVVTSGTTTTSITTGDNVTSFNDATVPTDSFLWLETTAQGGTVSEFHLTIRCTWD